MSLEILRNSLGEQAKDIKLNIAMILSESGAPELSLKQIYSIALAIAYANKNIKVINALLLESEALLTPKDIEAAKASAIIMAMNNIYYRFTHLVEDKVYANLPAKLRMNVLGNPPINKVDFELNCLAVSAVNGCGMCMDSHEKVLSAAAVSKVAIQSAIRIASVMHAFCLSVALSD